MKIQIFVILPNGNRFEVSDFYWFEEQGVHDFNGEGHFETYDFEIFINDKLELKIDNRKGAKNGH